MVTQRRAAILALLFPLALVAACDKVPLLAPTGTVITLIPTSTVVGLNSQTTIVATVIENGVASSGSGSSGASSSRTGAGTPVQNGTVITFTTTIGRIEPAEARTHNGQVTVTLFTDNTSGTPTITAYSGGASATLSTVKVGSGPAKTVTVTTTPQSLGSSGGSVTVQATVIDDTGIPIVGIPVTFSTTKGSVSPSTAVTGANGVATATLTTTVSADVTATAGTVSGKATVSVSAFGLSSFAANPTSGTTGSVILFNVGVTAGVNLSNVRVEFGDGQSQSLGPVSKDTSVPHSYCSPGTYTATATATDAAGGTGSLSTSVIIGALPVSVNAPAVVTVNTPANFSATVGGAPQVEHYVWTFGDGTPQVTTTGTQASHAYSSKGNYTVTLGVVGVGGCQIGTTSVAVSVQ